MTATITSPKGKASKSQNSKQDEVDFNGAAILNEDGTETPITEEMVQEACHQLETNENEHSGSH